MKDNIYQFPVGEQKNAFKNAVSAKKRKEQRNQAISKTGAVLRRFLDWSFSGSLRHGYRTAHCGLSAVRGVDCSQEANFLDWWLDLCDHILSS